MRLFQAELLLISEKSKKNCYWQTGLLNREIDESAATLEDFGARNYGLRSKLQPCAQIILRKRDLQRYDVFRVGFANINSANPFLASSADVIRIRVFHKQCDRFFSERPILFTRTYCPQINFVKSAFVNMINVFVASKLTLVLRFLGKPIPAF